jgi:hypothetical protein
MKSIDQSTVLKNDVYFFSVSFGDGGNPSPSGEAKVGEM